MPTLTKGSIDHYGEVATNSQIESVKKSLEANGFKVEIVDSLQEAKRKVLDIIPKGKEVFTATSVTLDKAGLTEELNSNKYISVRDKFMALYGQKDKGVEMRRIGSASDYTVGSVHGLTEDGQVVVASASGSQMPNYVYGASNVIWVVGSQKIVKDLNDAIERIETHTFPLEDARAQVAYGMNSSLNKILIFRKDTNKRITIVLVKEAVGY